MSLKKFEILEMVAKGGMAEVYRAKTVGFQGFEKEVCVKKILPHLTEDESFVTMFINEAKLAATLSYANIVSVHDLCVSAGGEYFIVMEYVHGKDLSDVIRAAQLAGREVPPDIAVYICREVAKGLHYAHTKTDLNGAPLNIIHRDISPHNVLISMMGEVKITDFGIAKASSIMNKTAVGILKGKYGYMSPEQARGQPLDHRSDIFNAGIVLYEMIVGERCFAGSSDFSTLNLMRNAVVTPPTKINARVPKELEVIVLKTLSADRNDRYKDALEFEAALAGFADARGKRASAPDLGVFMRELFAQNERARGPSSTGVLSLASVVGAPPDADNVNAKGNKAASPQPENAAPKRKDKSELAARPTEDKAAAKADKKGSRDLEPAPAELKPRETAAKKAQATPPKPNEAPAEAKEEAKPERKPARIKKDAEPKGAEASDEKKEKKGKKQLSDTPKKPVGRKELRPGLTQLYQLRRPETRRRAFNSIALLTFALAVGVGIGVWRTRGVSGENTFRELELKTRAPDFDAKKPTVTLLILSEPSGATVKFDNSDLADKTPLIIERDRDTREHEISLTFLDGGSARQTLRYESGPLTRTTVKQLGAPGTIKIATRPANVVVRLDGKEVGKTPLEREVPSGSHEVEIGGAEHETLKLTVEVKPGKVARIDKNISKKGLLASLDIRSEPQAQIILDDTPTGRWTNEAPLPVEADTTHRVSLLYGPKQSRHELILKLKSGETKSVFVDLSNTGSPGT